MNLHLVEVRAAAAAPARSVWRLLADPYSYARWVGGTKRVRYADPSWPAPGSRLHHTFGPWLIRVHDHTTVLAARPPREIVLQALARPLGRIRVEIDVSDAATGRTDIVLRELAQGGLVARFPRIGHAVQLRRNRRSVARLVAAAQEDASAS